MMRLIKNKSIRQELALAYFVAILLLAVIVALVTSNQIINHLREHEIAGTKSLAERFAKDSRIALIQMADENVIATVNMLLELPSVKNVSVLNSRGLLLVGEKLPEVAFNEIKAMNFAQNKQAQLLKETSHSFYIVAPVFIESKYNEEEYLAGMLDGDKQKSITSLIGYVLVDLDKTNLLAARDKVWRKTLLVMAVISALLLLGLMNVLNNITRPLKNLAALMTQSDTAKEYIKAPVYGVKEVRDISTAFNDLMHSLESTTKELVLTNEGLEERVIKRTKDLKDASDKASKLNEENRALISGMNNALEEERKYIARELHDHLNSDLLCIKLRLRRLKSAYGNAELSDNRSNSKVVDELIEQITEVYDYSRNIVKMLRPEVIDSLGLIGAIEDRVDMFRSMQANCKFKFIYEGDYSDLDYSFQMTIFRIIQESLTNIGKHAEASEVSVGLYRNSKKYLHGIVLLVHDNGKGFKLDEVSVQGIGLISMRERAYSLGGELEVQSYPGKGTTVKAKFPLK